MKKEENNPLSWELLQFEASSLDRINSTKNRLEFDQKKFTPTNLNVGT